MTKSIEAEYGVKKRRVKLYRRTTKSGKKLDVFESPGEYINVVQKFPEFTCLCPRTGHPDFATITLEYMTGQWCVEMKSLKYYYNSFRNEGHFHEQVTKLLADDLVGVLKPLEFHITSEFNMRGGMAPRVDLWWGSTEKDGEGHWF